MARIAIDIAPAQLARAKKLVDAGLYDSLQQLAEIAFANQLALEDGADPEDLAADTRKGRRGGGRPKTRRQRIPPLPPKTPAKNSEPRASSPAAAPEVPEATFESALAGLSLSLIAEETDVEPSAEMRMPAEQRMLALVNKPFGLKLAARAALVQSKREWPHVEALARDVGLAAATIGVEIAAEDRAAERTRNLLHTGLPALDKVESRARFGTQYVGRRARSGQVTPGAMVHCALATIEGGRVVLSRAGVEFAKLPNPVLDGGVQPWERVMAGPEQRYFLQHIKDFVPGEANDARVVVEAIHAGENRPELLLSAVRPALPSGWTDVQARSYLAGLVTRLAELDAVGRVWTGRTVQYELGVHASLLMEPVRAREIAG